MKTTHKSLFTDFLNQIIWILTTFLSMLNCAIIFIIRLFFYKNISIESEKQDFHDNISKDELLQQNHTVNLNSHSETENSSQTNENEISKDQSNSESSNKSDDEPEVNEEEEREKLKKKLEEEDEKDSQNERKVNEINDPKSMQSNKDKSEYREEDKLSQEIPKENEKSDTKNKSNELDTVNDEQTENEESTNESKENKRKRTKVHRKTHHFQEPVSQDEVKSINERKVSNTKQSEEKSGYIQTDIEKSAQKFTPELADNRRIAIENLILSEDEYCRNLNILLDVFREKLNGSIDKETDELLFGNVKPLFDLSTQYSDVLNCELKRGPEKAEVWKCFTNIEQIAEVYEPYLSNHKKAISTYKKMLITNLKFLLITKKIEMSDPNDKFTSIAEIPILQLHRTPTLLSEILKYTPEWHPDYQKLPKTISTLIESYQNIEKQSKINESNSKLQEIEDQIVDCPHLVSKDRTYLGTFKLFDWKKLYILSDMLLVVRGKRLRKTIKMSSVKFVWLDSNTGTVHISTQHKKDIKFRGGIRGSTIYTILKNKINQKSCIIPTEYATHHQPYLYRKSDLVRAPPPPSSTLYSSVDDSNINTETDSNSFTVSLFSNNSTNSGPSTNSNTNDENNRPRASSFIDSKDNNLNDDDDLDDTDDDDDDDDDDTDFGSIPEITGNIEESDSKGNNTKLSTSSSDESCIFTEEMIDNRQKAIKNLISSEKKYQQSLHNLISLYKPKFSKSIVNEKTEQTVFGNLSPLIVLSEQYSKILDEEFKKGADKAEVWKCFTLTPDSMKFFQIYLSNYTNMLFHYNNFILSDKKIKKFVKKIEDENPDNLFTTLSSAPFARIAILIQQLQDICKVTPKWHPDSEHLPATISKFNEITNDSAKKCVEADNLEKLIQIETTLIDCPSLFSSSRSFLKSFNLEDKGSIYVLNDLIIFARSSKKVKYSLKFSDIKKISNKNNSIGITMNDGKTHSIKSNDQTQTIFDFLKQQKAKQTISV